ncbi:MAG: hypothetical protein HY319_27735 [Armatimonadetes bacterium]|nr:hypothetical protein [Armatimonadota bacterium]
MRQPIIFLVLLLLTLPAGAQTSSGGVELTGLETTVVRNPGDGPTYPWKIEVAGKATNTTNRDLRQVVVICEFKTPEGKLYSQDRREFKLGAKASADLYFQCLNQNPAGGKIADAFMDMQVNVKILSVR